MKKNTIIFDLDGTLIDTAPDLAGTMNYLLKKMGRDELELSQVRRFIGHGAKALMERAFKFTGEPIKEDQIEPVFEEFLEHYSKNGSLNSKPFPHILEALDIFDEANIEMGICTNKQQKLTEMLLSDLNLKHRFKSIKGGDAFDFKKPDPRHLLKVVEELECDKENTIYVGDSDVDIITAKNAGIKVIGVTFGYSTEPIETYEPDLVLDDFQNLWDAYWQLLKY